MTLMESSDNLLSLGHDVLNFYISILPKILNFVFFCFIGPQLPNLINKLQERLRIRVSRLQIKYHFCKITYYSFKHVIFQWEYSFTLLPKLSLLLRFKKDHEKLS